MADAPPRCSELQAAGDKPVTSARGKTEAATVCSWPALRRQDAAGDTLHESEEYGVMQLDGFLWVRQGQRDYMSSSGTLKGLGVQIGMNPASVKVIFY